VNGAKGITKSGQLLENLTLHGGGIVPPGKINESQGSLKVASRDIGLRQDLLLQKYQQAGKGSGKFTVW